MIFVDTSAWFALLVPTDPDHTAAKEWLRQSTQPLATTDYVLDELLTLLVYRGEGDRIAAVADSFFTQKVASIQWTTEEVVQESLLTLQRFRDKRWSFTDCVSRTVMQRMGIETAFAFDEHFTQFGTVTVVPQLP
jgi:predicted nucleic acid-binding protein